MAESKRLEKGDVVDDRFVLEAPLGRGSFASVWGARDRAHGDRQVALKLLLEHHAADEKKLKRFVQEARILERLDHPNIAQPIAWSAKPDGAYLAMELIDGDTLSARLEEHGGKHSMIPREGVSWIADQLASAVGYAHAQSIVHRDLKPKNVMINRRGQRPFIKVLDFGIAKILLGSELDPTTVGKVLGSILYIAPEQVLAEPLDHRADIFALGTILFEVITLRRAWARDTDGLPLPFEKPVDSSEANSHIAIVRRIGRETRPSAADLREDLPRAVDEVLARAMAIKAKDRYDSVDEMARALRMALVSRGGPARRGKIADATTELDRPAKKLDDPTDHKPESALEWASEIDPPTLREDKLLTQLQPHVPRALPRFKSAQKTDPAGELTPEGTSVAPKNPALEPTASGPSAIIAGELTPTPGGFTPVPLDLHSASAVTPIGALSSGSLGASEAATALRERPKKKPRAILGMVFFALAILIALFAYLSK